MLKPIFLDTCVFFECIDDSRKTTTIHHAKNLGYIISTSITVLGEAIDQIREHNDRDWYLSAFMSFLNEWEVWTFYPDQVVARVCNCLANREIDFRVEKTDRVHFGYAISNDCSYFVTSDKNLLSTKFPRNLNEQDFPDL